MHVDLVVYFGLDEYLKINNFKKISHYENHNNIDTYTYYCEPAVDFEFIFFYVL
jgi:hypothetical protein